MALFPLFIDPAMHQGALTFAAMAVTVAVITAAYCLTLSACAHAVTAYVWAHQRIGRWLERLAGVFLLGLGIRLGSQ